MPDKGLKMLSLDALAAPLWLAMALLAAGGCPTPESRPPAAETSAAEAAPGVHGWSPPKADLVFVSNRDGDGEIYLLPAGGGEWVNLTDHPASDNWPEWSPDGSRILFQSRRNGNLDIFVMNADGSGLEQLTDDPEHDYLASWSPDGESIVFTSWRREPGDGERANHIYRMDADGSDQRRLFGESPGVSADARWAPDGSRLALAMKRDAAAADIYLLAPDGRVVERLTDEEASNGAPAFSPDGSRIAFYADDGERSELVVRNLVGGAEVRMGFPWKSWYPRWSADGRWLICTASGPGGDEDLDLIALPLEGGRGPVTLVGGPARAAEGRWRPPG